MRPRKRYLPGNKGTEGPTSLVFFDSESNEPEHVPGGNRREMTLRLWVAAYVRRDGPTWREPIYHQGTTAAQWWALVERLSSWSRPLWAFAHNLGHDLTQLCFWDELERRRWTAGPVEREPDPDTGKRRPPWRGRLCLESRPTFLVVRGRFGLVKMVDTGNYWPTSLAAIGERAGLGKLPMPAWSADDDAWFTYCRRDVDVARVAVCDLLERWLTLDCGTFQMTAPQLAMSNFRHTCKCRAGKHDAVNVVLEDESPARPIERAAYLGGRIEPFYVGPVAGPIYHLDCNSLYLSQMASQLYPRCRVRRVHDVTPAKLAGLLAAYGVVADVRINTQDTLATYPTKSNGVQVHASGIFWTTLCTPELIRASSAGHIDRVGECHLYSLAALFAGWADVWLERKKRARLAGDHGEEEFAKLIGNSLAGKFGQRGEWWVDAPDRAARADWGFSVGHDPKTGDFTHYRYIARHVQRKVPGLEPKQAFPAISAHVCAHGRERMLQAFALMPERSLLYSATDSIICTQAGFFALLAAGQVDETEAGLFRLVGQYDSAEFCGPNWYRVGDRWSISGLHGRARLGANGEPIVEVWDHLATLLHGNPHGRCGINVLELGALKPTLKNLAGPDGFRVPLRFTYLDGFGDRPPRLVNHSLAGE